MKVREIGRGERDGSNFVLKNKIYQVRENREGI